MKKPGIYSCATTAPGTALETAPGDEPILFGEVAPPGDEPILFGEVAPPGDEPILFGEVAPPGARPRLANGQFVSRLCPDPNCGGELRYATEDAEPGATARINWICDGLTHDDDGGALEACRFGVYDGELDAGRLETIPGPWRDAALARHAAWIAKNGARLCEPAF